ncbi:MAG: glycosyltransferase family 2 protein [Pseudomonadota bacterium]
MLVTKEQRRLSMGVVVPAFNAEETLPACLNALIAAGFERELIFVVDDNSSDTTKMEANARGVHVLANIGNLGAAESRNLGALKLKTDILVFVDADVEVASDVKDRFLKHFDDAERDAVFGSYDDAPHRTETVSRLRNLLHHTTHQKSSGPISSFWTGLGAVRREVFENAGGFDAKQRMLEDVEFGLRLTAMGNKIVLDPGIQGKHWKHWDLKSMVKTDFWDRAVPWTKLLMSPLGQRSAQTLSVSPASKISVFATGLCCLALPLSLIVPLAALLAFVVGVCMVSLANADYLKCVFRLDGWTTVPKAIAVLLLHFFSAGLGYAAVRVRLL